MPTRIALCILALLSLLNARAEESPSSVLTAISSTTISGYVNTSAYWNPGAPLVTFEDLGRTLRQQGFRLKNLGPHHLVYRDRKFAFYLHRHGSFALRSDVVQVRRALALSR